MNGSRVPSLTLHDVSANGAPPSGEGEAFYRIAETDMEELLGRLRKRGYRSVSSRQFRAWQRGEGALPDKPIALTFDDGYASHFSVVTPMLVRHRFTGIFFITTDFVGRPGYVTWDQLRKMAFMGMEIGSHGKTHRRLTGLSPRERALELSESKRVIEAELGVPVKAFAAPGGFWSRPAAIDAARAGYDAAWLSEIGINGAATQSLYLKRLPVHQPVDWDRLLGMIEGSRRLLWAAIARQRLIVALKALIGVSGYERLKHSLFKDGE